MPQPEVLGVALPDLRRQISIGIAYDETLLISPHHPRVERHCSSLAANLKSPLLSSSLSSPSPRFRSRRHGCEQRRSRCDIKVCLAIDDY